MLPNIFINMENSFFFQNISSTTSAGLNNIEVTVISGQMCYLELASDGVVYNDGAPCFTG